MKILIIEDDADLAASLWDYLESKGHVIDAAGDGRSGLHLAAANTYDVIVLDLILPGLDGLELCRRLRVDVLKSTPVLIVTARTTTWSSPSPCRSWTPGWALSRDGRNRTPVRAAFGQAI